CHGPDPKANKAELRLDLPKEAYRKRMGESGKEITPIVPGHPEESEAWRRISTGDEMDVMPPIDNLHQLSDRDKAVIRRWIEQGAEYQSHWAYITPTKSPLPEVDKPALVRNAIDAFILAELDNQNVEPSDEADRSTLIRRLSLDLIGLPPTPEEVDAFVNDPREDAYEQLTNRLLASPHFGERMAVPWLDVVRFADTVGFHGDQGLNIFPYRDYVIEAFNKNKPYDEFVTEQIAGDLLPNPSVEQIVATGFNRLNMVTREGGAQTKEYLAKYAADRVRAVATTFLGSTMGCTECHDHKFDPFTTKDFYSMAAFFADVKQYGVYSDYTYTPEPELKGWSNDFPFPPEIEVKSPYLERRQARLTKEFWKLVNTQAAEVISESKNQAEYEKWLQSFNQKIETNPTGWESLHPISATSTADTKIEIKSDESVLFLDQESDQESDEDSKEEIVLTYTPAPGPLATLRLDVLTDPAHEGNIFRGEQVRLDMGVEWQIRRPGEGKAEAITIYRAYANLITEIYFNGYLETSVRQDFKSSRNHTREPYQINYFLKTPVDWQEGDELVAILKSDHVGRVQVSTSPLGLTTYSDAVLQNTANASVLPVDSVEDQIPLTAKLFVMSRDWNGGGYVDLLYNYHEISKCRDGYAFTVVTQSTDPLLTRVLVRGNWKDESGEIVSPSAPKFLVGEVPVSGNQRQSRLDLAHWMTSPDNPLTARTFVNRLWAQFFGTGISAVVDDLGNQGEWPSHPELLDWLAVEFVESGWDIKALVRLLVISGTYRQSSKYRPELAKLDPDNRLLARQIPRRLEAEFVRDNALFISGLINREIGGPSSRPYQPEGYYAPLNFPVRKYQDDTDDRQYRRGVYTHWQRTFLHPMLANFDAPGREECTAQRTQSNTPQQALTLLNDPTFVEAARVFAQSVLQASEIENGISPRLDSIYNRALARSPSDQESESLTKFFKGRLEYYQGEPDEAEAFTSIGHAPIPDGLDPIELAAWSAVTRVVLNLNETIVRY
ncbi:MAG: PSD1 and planctomycete cytochrome C domain-containing protein, partial [Verrucomicrobia bacterium]|nr:PSD1 and planctomycete cytochrome C domain-containing protein [Verrucomicrobiota bacterium]